MKKAITLLICFLWGAAFVLKGQTPRLSSDLCDLPNQLWTDIVTEQPEGYVVDENGDVHIHTAEALAWLSVLSNGLHGQEVEEFEGKTVYLEDNVDLAGYAWNPIATFKGVFYGKRHTMHNLLLSNSFSIGNGGFFRNVVHGEVRNVNLENCTVDFAPASQGLVSESGVLAYSLEGSSVVDNCTVHCSSFQASQGAMFKEIGTGSSVKSCLVQYGYKKESGSGSGIGTCNYGQILNCASIIDRLYWPEGGCSGLVQSNRGEIQNCYSYWGELEDFPYYGGGLAPRNGVASDNENGFVENCYYNQMPEKYGFDDGPGEGGVFQEVVSFFRYDIYYGWMLTDYIQVGSNVAWPYDLVDALNLWIANSNTYRKWFVDPTGSNNKLPVFKREPPEDCWTDIVTEQPEGYVVDENGDVHIHTAEALAWLSVLSNGLHGQETEEFEGRTVYLEEDVDLDGYAWYPIATFKGVFDGKQHFFYNLFLSKGFGIENGGFFKNVVHGEIRNLNLENCTLDFAPASQGFVSESGVLAYSLEDYSVVSNCSLHCLSFQASQGSMFMAIRSGSLVENCLIHYDYKKESEYGSGFSPWNNGQIVNCAVIIDILEWSWGGCSGLVWDNRGEIKNCYSYWGELLNFPGYSGFAPRNGVAEGNIGIVENCYYNRMPSEYCFDDGPGGGMFQDVSSFDREGGGWRLTNPINVGVITTNDLVEVLNLWVENQPDGEGYLKWSADTTGFNHGLPVFEGCGFMEIGEQVSDAELAVYPNPADVVVSVKSKGIKRVLLFDIVGRRMDVVATVDTGDAVSIDLGGLAHGLYFLEIVDGKSCRMTSKIIKR